MHLCHSQAIWLYLLYHKFFGISANLRGADRLHFITFPKTSNTFFAHKREKGASALPVSFIPRFWFIIHSDSTKRMALFLCQTVTFHKNVAERRKNLTREFGRVDMLYWINIPCTCRENHGSLQSEQIMQFKFLQKTYLFILNIQVDNFNFHLHC